MVMRSDTVGRPMHILLVEDMVTFARITMAALKKSGLDHRLTWLTDGNEALDFLHRRGKFLQAPLPDLVLLDLGLPTRDGREVLAEMKSDPGLAAIPVVIMTASHAEEDRLAAERLEVQAYLTKPVDLEKFLVLIKQLKRFWHEDMILQTCV